MWPRTDAFHTKRELNGASNAKPKLAMGELDAGTSQNGRHFSAGHGDLSQCIEQSYEGMAHFAGTGPKGETCGGCRHFRRGRGKNRACGKFAELTGVGSKKIPPDAAACKYFERSS
jgi:hypothetical protein